MLSSSDILIVSCPVSEVEVRHRVMSMLRNVISYEIISPYESIRTHEFRNAALKSKMTLT